VQEPFGLYQNRGILHARLAFGVWRMTYEDEKLIKELLDESKSLEERLKSGETIAVADALQYLVGVAALHGRHLQDLRNKFYKAEKRSLRDSAHFGLLYFMILILIGFIWARGF